MEETVGEGAAVLGWDGERNEKIRVLFEMGDGDLMEKKGRVEINSPIKLGLKVKKNKSNKH